MRSRGGGVALTRAPANHDGAGRSVLRRLRPGRRL